MHDTVVTYKPMTISELLGKCLSYYAASIGLLLISLGIRVWQPWLAFLILFIAITLLFLSSRPREGRAMLLFGILWFIHGYMIPTFELSVRNAVFLFVLSLPLFWALDDLLVKTEATPQDQNKPSIFPDGFDEHGWPLNDPTYHNPPSATRES